MVLVLAHESSFNAFFSFLQIRPDSADVDEQTVLRVDPTSINYVQFVGLVAINIMWVHLQQIGPSVLDTRQSVMIFGHVVVFGQKSNCWFRNLDVNVAIPRQNFLIPKPSQKSAMHDPSFGTDIGHCGQEGLHEGCQMWETFSDSHLRRGEPAIVMRMKS